jgi:phage terminase large subunit GpA-like protein
MSKVLSEIEQEFRRLSMGEYLASAREVAAQEIGLLLPPEEVSTTDCAAAYRYISNPEGGGSQLWSLSRTPYMRPIQDACDDPRYNSIVVVGPERSGKSIGGENLLFKRLKFGPLTDTIIYLPPGIVDDYADQEFADLFRLHPDDIGRGLSKEPRFNKKKFKLFRGKSIRVFAASAGNLKQKQAPLIIATEVDGLRSARTVFKEIQGRQKSFGVTAKSYLESHPDLGWDGCIVPAWKAGTMGVFYWQCSSCGGWSTPHQTAPPEMRATMIYSKDDTLEALERAELAERTAKLLCPHNGCMLDDDERYGMIDGMLDIHAGMSISADGEVTGERKATNIASFWLHGLNVKRPLGPLAREHCEAQMHFDNTGRFDLLKRYYVKSVGEATITAAAATGLSPKSLKQRTQDFAKAEEPVRYRLGEVPRDVMFITAAVDVAGNRFDVALRGFDLRRRSWLIDRFTIRQRLHPDGVMRDLAPSKVQEDWSVLESQVIDRLLPLQDDPAKAMPVAVTLIDASDGNVTWRAYEFARRMDRKRWGVWRKVRCIKGATTVNAPPLPVTPTTISRDNDGKAVEPHVTLHMLGVHKLKADTIADLAIDDGGPGQCYFPVDMPSKAYDEFFGETLIDGKWVRNGPNETLDLYGYTEAARLMLQPDREKLKWTGPERAIWSAPVSLTATQEGGDQAAGVQAPPAAPRESIFARFDALNQG